MFTSRHIDTVNTAKTVGFTSKLPGRLEKLCGGWTYKGGIVERIWRKILVGYRMYGGFEGNMSTHSYPSVPTGKLL